MVANSGYDRLFGALESGNITIYGNDYLTTSDGTCERDYISLKDICSAYIKGIDTIFGITPSQNPKEKSINIKYILNICWGVPLSVRHIIDTWNKLSNNFIPINGKKLPYVQETYGSRREGDPSIVYGSNYLAKEIIHWSPEKTLEDIIIEIGIDKYS